MPEIDILKALESKEFRDSFLWKALVPAVAQQIKELRLSRGLTQQQLADGIGTKAATISRWESATNAHTITIGSLLRIATFFDVGLLVRFVDWPTFLRFLREVDGRGAPASFTVEQMQSVIHDAKRALAAAGCDV